MKCWCGTGTYLGLYFDCLLQHTTTAITIATIAVTITRRTTTATDTTITITVASVDESVAGLGDGSAGGTVDGATEAAEHGSGCRESITTGHVVSTCSCVEATVMYGVEVIQEVRKEGMSTCAMPMMLMVHDYL